LKLNLKKLTVPQQPIIVDINEKIETIQNNIPEIPITNNTAETVPITITELSLQPIIEQISQPIIEEQPIIEQISQPIIEEQPTEPILKELQKIQPPKKITKYNYSYLGLFNRDLYILPSPLKRIFVW